MGDLNTIGDIFEFTDERIQDYKEELITILQEKLNNIHIEFAGTESNYCELSGYTNALKFSIEIIKNF